MGEKDREVRSREQLFDLLTQNTDDIFVLFSPAEASPSISYICRSWVRSESMRMNCSRSSREQWRRSSLKKRTSQVFYVCGMGKDNLVAKGEILRPGC